MVLKILFVVCLVVMAICVPWYLKALWPEKCRKSLILKMICSTMFVSIGVLSVYISGNTSTYAIIMIIGLIFGWIGDYFLHAKPSDAYFVTGFLSFLIGHFFYIGAYVRTLPKLFPNYEMISGIEIAVEVLFIALGLIALKVFKVKLNPKILKIGIYFYFAIVTFMFVKASALGFNYYKSGAPYGIVAFVLLSLGSLFFVLSDATLGIISFGGQKKNYPLKIFNILTYFWGQAMLASSILFIEA